MANAGFFLGGLSDTLNQGLQRNQQGQLQQQELQIQQQGQQQAQQRFQQTQYMQLYSQGVQHMADFFEQWKLAHPDGDIKQAAAAMAPTKDNLKTLLKNMGQDPESIEGLWAGMIAAPSKAVTERAQKEAVTPNSIQKIHDAAGDESLVGVNPYTLKSTPIEGGSTSPPDMSGLHGPELRAALAKRSGLTPEQIDINARALNDGNLSVLTNLGRGKQGGEAVKAIRAASADILINEEGMSPQQAAEYVNANVADYAATKAGAVSLGRREAMVTGAATTAMQTAPRVLEASKSVSRTDYPTINSLIEAAQKQTGGENVIRLGIAVNTFVNNYARAIGAGNAAVTNSARAEAFENLDKAWGKGQIAAAVDQMLNKELPSEITGAKMGIREYLSKKTGVRPTAAQGGQDTTPGSGISGSSGNVRFSFTPGQ